MNLLTPIALIAGLGIPEIGVILFILLVLFGGPRLIKKIPDMGKNLGEGIREMRKASKAFSEELEEGKKDVIEVEKKLREEP
jgi:sec-independent protein translocase protein TatA